MSKQGSTISGLLDTISILTSLGLQYGVPLEVLIAKLSHMRFEPSGFTGTDLGYASSIVDYVFRWLKQFATEEEIDEQESSAPTCAQCGALTVPSGACHCCPQCGTSSGCS